MTVGKAATKHTQVMIDGYDMSGDTNNIAGLTWTFETADVTAYSDGWQNSLVGGVAKVGVDGYKAWFNNYGSGVLNNGLSSASAVRVISVALGGRAAVAAGDPVFAARLQQTKYSAVPAFGEAVAVEAEFAAGAADGVFTVSNPWGVVLKPLALISSTTNGATIDNGAATTNGGAAYLHVTVAGGTWAIAVYHSTDNFSANNVLLGTFTADGTAITAEQLTFTGTINRYVRYVATRTSGNLTALISFTRNQ